MSTIDETLKVRGGVHGDWPLQAAVADKLAGALGTGERWDALTPSQRQALLMIATKLARIVSGDPNHADHWHDIAGYATLAHDQLMPSKGDK
jgi:hypothetical protein